VKNEIKIVCPGQKCGKCRRMIDHVMTATETLGVKPGIEIIDDPEKMALYNTWILPTLVINGKIVARGYVPSVQMIQKHLINITDKYNEDV
jgi:hypothetical protein